MELESKALRLAIADAIVQKLWFKGLINDTERDRMKENDRVWKIRRQIKNIYKD